MNNFEENMTMYRAQMARLILVALIFLSGLAVPAQAQVTADQMTCASAVATYERVGRIYVRTGSGVVLPIYVGVPINKKSSLRCDSATDRAVRYNVKTKDARSCSIAYVCQ